MAELRVVGQGRPVKDAYAKVTGQIQYTGDMKFQGMLYGKLILSDRAHARVVSIDASEALKLPGVEAVVTCFDVPEKPFNTELRFYDHDIPKTEQIFHRVSRHVGDRIGAVAARDLPTAEKALTLIKVEYEDLPAVFDVREAIQEGAPQIHEGIPNAIREIKVSRGDLEAGFAEADLIFEDEYETPIIAQMAMENHVSTALYDHNGKLTVYTSTQNIFAVRNLLSYALDLPMTRVRVVKPPLGGAFGSKIPMVLEAPAAVLAMKTGKPVKVELKRKENFVATRTRHGSVVRLKTGVKKDGTLVAQEIDVLLNTGAYVSSGLNVGMAMSHKGFKPYKVPNLSFRAVPVLTNLPNAGAMRGYGSPQLFAAQQMQFNKIVRALGIDMTEFQLKNLVVPEAETLASVGNPRPVDCVEKGMEMFDWERRVQEAASQDPAARIRRGVGMAVGCHGNGVFGAHRDFISMILKMNEDGTFHLLTPSHDMGNGLPTAEIMVVAEVLGILPEDVETYETDTDVTPWNLGDYSSRGVFVCCNAARKAAEAMRDKLLNLAAMMWETDGSQVSLGTDKEILCADGRKATFTDVILYAHRDRQEDVVVEASYANEAGRTSYGAHFVDLEVDLDTGKVKVNDYVAVHDVGAAINLQSLEGQLEGGIHMGLGYALTEEMTFDEKGAMTNANLKRYQMLKAADMPEIRIAFIEEGDEPGPYGAKSIGECATVPSGPAVANAVANALDMDVYRIPLRPERILELLKK